MNIDLNNLNIGHAKMFNNIHNELVEEYHKLIESMYNRTDGSIDWIVNSLFSRNNYLSNVYHVLGSMP